MRWVHVFCRLCAAALGVCALNGCASSPPVQYFALESVAPQGAAVTPSSPISIQVAQVHLPPALDRKQMVRHTGPFTLDISDQHRWSAPLDEMVRRVLSEDLMRALPPGSVVLPEEPAPSATRKIVVNIVEFAPDASGTIHFEGTWSLVTADSPGAPQNRSVRLAEPADAKDPADQVKAMSRILDRLATAMAGAVATSPR